MQSYLNIVAGVRGEFIPSSGGCIEITVKALDPFSSLVPLATDIKHAVEGEDDNYLGCEAAPCTLCSSSRCPPAAQPVRPRPVSPRPAWPLQAAWAAPGLHQGASLGVHSQSFLGSQRWPCGHGVAWAPLLRAACAVHPSAHVSGSSFSPPAPPMPGVFLTFAGLSSLGSLPSLHSLHALQHRTVTFTSLEDGNPFGTLLGLPAPCPVGPSREGFLPTALHRPAPNNTLTESSLCPLEIGSQKSLMSELCI